MTLAPTEITQVAFLVRDVEATMRAYHEAFGWGPWSIFELRPPLLHDTRVRGRLAECDMLAAIAPAGPIDIELFQPLGPGPFADLLEQGGEGFHHICCRRVDSSDKDLEARLEACSERPPVLTGRVSAELEFAYVDLVDNFKTVVETLSGQWRRRESRRGSGRRRARRAASPRHDHRQGRGGGQGLGRVT